MRTRPLRSSGEAYRLKDLIEERYKDGSAVLKEIFQNANDAQASKVSFGFLNKMLNAPHPLLDSNFIFFLNNGAFSEDDDDAISRLGMDEKQHDLGKLGKFGLGQKSVFHVCEMFFYFAKLNKKDGISENILGAINPWTDDDENQDLPQYNWGKEWKPEHDQIFQDHLYQTEIDPWC